MPEQSQTLTEQLAIAEQEYKTAAYTGAVLEIAKFSGFVGGMVAGVVELTGGNFESSAIYGLGGIAVGFMAKRQLKTVSEPDLRSKSERVSALKSRIDHYYGPTD